MAACAIPNLDTVLHSASFGTGSGRPDDGQKHEPWIRRYTAR